MSGAPLDGVRVTGPLIGRALRRGVRCLLGAQAESGAFPGIVSDRPDLGGWQAPDCSIFDTAGVLRSLRFASGAALKPLRERATAFLRREMIPPGIWGYWPRGAARADIAPDADDTAVVLDVLGKSLPEAAVAAGRAALLANRAEDGRFKTWLAPAGASNDIDSVVNANVVVCLGPGPETRPAERFLHLAVRSPVPRETYWYYADDAALFYAVSRVMAASLQYTEELRRGVVDAVLARSPDTGSPLRCALEACALLNGGIAEGPALAGRLGPLLATQRPDGSWPAEAYYAGPRAPEPRSVWFGCEAGTTALCIEALSQFAWLSGLPIAET